MSLAESPQIRTAPADATEADDGGDATPKVTESGTVLDKSGKAKKRGLFGFGKKKTVGGDDSVAPKHSQLSPQHQPASFKTASSNPTPTPGSSAANIRRSTTSPVYSEFAAQMMPPPSSPGRGGSGGLYSSSPRLASPAGSQIFERDVQESATGQHHQLPASPAIPSHIQTENYIPPVLDASSEAITDDHLDPDLVEIITHAHHQPAAVTVTGAPPVLQPSFDSMASSWADELVGYPPPPGHGAGYGDDAASNYGSLDTTDIRRLSFISFADVVQAEKEQLVDANQPGNRSSMHIAGLTSLASVAGLANRSPSPMRSPVSLSSTGAGGVTASPPTSKSGSVKGLDLSPPRKPLGSPALSAGNPSASIGGGFNLNLASVGASTTTSGPTSPTGAPGSSSGAQVVGELAIETMSSALRRTGSADLGALRSMPTSPIDGPSQGH